MKYYADKIYFKNGSIIEVSKYDKFMPKTVLNRRYGYDSDTKKCFKETTTRKGTKTEEIGIFVRSSSQYYAYSLSLATGVRLYASVCRLVASAIYQSKLDYIIANELDTHHIDCNKDNNIASNLIMIDKQSHNMIHQLVRHFGMSPVEALAYVRKQGAKIVDEVDWIE